MTLSRKILFAFCLILSVKAPAWGMDYPEGKSSYIISQVKNGGIVFCTALFLEALMQKKGFFNRGFESLAYNKFTRPVTGKIYEAYYSLVHVPINYKEPKILDAIRIVTRIVVPYFCLRILWGNGYIAGFLTARCILNLIFL